MDNLEQLKEQIKYKYDINVISNIIQQLNNNTNYSKLYSDLDGTIKNYIYMQKMFNILIEYGILKHELFVMIDNFIYF